MTFEAYLTRAENHPSAVTEEHCRELASGQNPDVLFITCSDSRVIPSRLTGAEPGQLFELRTAGNVVPKYRPETGTSEMATIEYAVLRLGVPNIVVCGHSHCGAVTAMAVAGRGLSDMPALCTWFELTGEQRDDTEVDPAVRAASQQHVRDQLAELREYPFIRDRLANGELALHGWFFELDTGRVHTLECGSDAADANTAVFHPL
ncbi:carbonic anhydrase [Salinifilum aidingensis]